MNRTEMQQKLNDLQKEYDRSGPIHRKDVWRQINRLRREIQTYDRFQAENTRPD